MNKPIQYLLVGFPYSGKSTLARELEKRLGFADVSIDRLKFDKGYKDKSDDDVPDLVWNEIFSEADNLIVKYLKQGKNVVSEYAWISKEWRERAREVAEKAGFITKLIYIKVPKEIIWERWLDNSKTKARFHLSKDEVKRAFKDLEEPTSDEDVIIYDQTVSVEKWIKKLL